MTSTKDHFKLTWEDFRFAIVGPLLAAPPEQGQLQAVLRELASKQWAHPLDPNRLLRFSRATIERWYYKALRTQNPVKALRRQQRQDAGTLRALMPAVQSFLKLEFKS